MTIDINMTDEAVSAALSLQNDNENWHDKPLRLYLDGKGCDGFDYGVSFDVHEEGDIKLEKSGITLVVDKDTFDIVKGSSIEWVDDERGTGFLVENPNHSKFKGKFFRKKNWKERLL